MVRSGLALVLAILVVSGVTSGALFAKEIRADARLRLTARAETMIISLTDRLLERGDLTTADVERLAPADTEVVLRDSNGAVVARTGPVLADQVMSVDVSGPEISATVSADRAPVDRRVHRTWGVIAAIAAAIAGAAAVAALLQARQLSRPLDRLARTAMQLGAGESGVVAPRSGVTEVDAIAEALEESGHRVAALVAAERQFSANASHQLRSPLTAIAISLELIADSEDPVARHEAVEALSQVAGLDERINELLQLARTGRVAPPERTDVVSLVGRHLESIGLQFEKAGRRLSFVAPESVEAVVTPSALTQGIEILLDNALVHGVGDVEVRIVATQADADVAVVEISITDEGEFDNAGNSVDAHVPPGAHRSHGLGLVLARNLLRPDGGRVELTCTSPTTFVVRLPVATVAASGASRADLLPHERRIGAGEQHYDSSDQGGDLPPGEHETLRQ